mgnify:CR=1 FL=1
MKKSLQQGLLSAMIISLVACGGGGGGGSSKSSTPASSVAPSSTPASSVGVSSTSSQEASSLAPSSTPASSVAPSSVAPSSAEASSSVVSSTPASSSSSSVASGIETTFNVRITPPQLASSGNLTKPGRSAAAKKSEEETLPLNQLAVVVVDLAGNVVRTIPLNDSNSTQNPDGSWSIRVPGYPQLDCIVIADLNGPITVFQPGSNVFDSDYLFAPTTGEDLDVSLASTAAYQNFVDSLGGEGTFADLGLDVTDPAQVAVLDNLIKTIQEVLEGQAFIGASSIAAALDQVKTQVQNIVKVEADNIKAPAVETTLAASALAGNLYWFESYQANEIFYGVLSRTNAEGEFIYDGDQFVRIDYEDDGDLVLQNGEWVVSSDRFRISAENPDGSITLSDETGPEQINVKPTQTINLANRNIASFFNAYGDTRGMVPSLDPSANFAAGSIVYRTNLTAVNDMISLWYEPGNETGVCPWDNQKNANDYGGNCDTLGGWSWSANQSFGNYSKSFTSIAAIKSPDVDAKAVGSVLLGINWPGGSETITVQLVDNAAKAARYYSYDYNTQNAVLLGTGTWSDLSLPGLQGAAAAAIALEVPTSVSRLGDFSEDERSMVFVLNEGHVRIGHQYKAGQVYETGVLIHNETAAQSTINAMDYQPPIAGTWVIGGDYVTFRKNGTFAQVKISNEDPNCQLGFVYGTYSLNAENDAFSVEVEEDTTAVDPEDSCSVVGINTLKIDGNTMTMTEGEDTFELTKVVPSESSPLAGAWASGGDLFTFTSDNTFIHAKIENDDPNCHTGWASGSFTWDPDTKLMIASVDQDFTDDFEESTCTLEGELNATLDGNSLLISVEGDEVTLKRFGNPLN